MDTTGKPTTKGELTLWRLVTDAARDLDKKTIIDPAMVAHEASKKLTPELKDLAVSLTLRHIAREVLRKLHKPNGVPKIKSGRRADPDAPTFSGEDFNLLQERYPKAHVDGKPQGYTTRDALTEEDWNWNVDQLLYDGGAKTAHGRQLERWGKTIKGFGRIEKSKEQS